MSESQTPRINAQAYWHEDKHVVDYETAFEIEKELLSELTATRARLAELETEKNVLRSDNDSHIQRCYAAEAKLYELERIASRLACNQALTTGGKQAILDYEAYKEGKK